MTRRFEKGSVVGFVLVGVLLAAVLVGGIWLARRPAGTAGDIATDTSTNQTNNAESDNDSTSTTNEELKETLNEQAGQSANNEGTSNNTGTSNLPVSGPGDVAVQLVGASLLTASAVAYLRSRSVA